MLTIVTQTNSTSDTDDAGRCKTTLDVVYRDFNVGPDFERSFSGDVVRRHLVKPDLDGNLKPQFNDTPTCQDNTTIGCGCPGLQPQNGPDASFLNMQLDCDPWYKVNTPVVTSKDTFDQWYRDVDGVNVHFQKTLNLSEKSPGSGIYVYDSSAFFPLEPSEGFGITPPNNLGKNFLFTTEIHLAGQKFTFVGDDDMWIFVNNKLALDLGSMHLAATGVIDFDAEADYLGITPGNTYPMAIFHAERHTSASNFHIETNISCFTSIIVPEPPK